MLFIIETENINQEEFYNLVEHIECCKSAFRIKERELNKLLEMRK